MILHRFDTIEAWREARMAGGTLGASDAARIVSGAYDGAWGVYADWHGIERERPKYAGDGLDVEPLILALYRQTRPDLDARNPGHVIAIHPNGWASASPDLLVTDPREPCPDGGGEMKDHRYLDAWAWGPSAEITSYAAWADERPVPLYELAQCYWQCWVLGWSWVDLVVLLPVPSLLRIYRIRRDERAIAAIVAKVEDFRDRLLIEGDPPPVDGSDACAAWLSHRAAVLAEGRREATEDEARLVESIRHARRTRQDAEAAEALDRNTLLAAMTGAKGITIGPRVAAYTSAKGRLTVR